MKQKGGVDKVSQIICLSNDYLTHKKNIHKIKGLVDHSSPKRNNDIDDYLYRKNTYREVRRSMQDMQLNKQNQKIVERITNITDRRNESRASTRSNQSSRSTLSAQVIDYKARRSFIKTKVIQQQNNKLSERIRNARFKDRLAPKHSQHLVRQNKNFKKVHSKFSERSQSEMREILNGLDYDHRKIPFLPALPSRRGSLKQTAK